MIPFRDDNPRLVFPWITCTLIVLNVLVHVVQWQLGEGGNAFLYRWGAIPWEIRHLAEWPELPLAYRSGPWNFLTPVTSLFLHGSWLHLLGNMLYLYIFGDNVESIMGHGRFLVFYLVGGVLASLAHLISAPNSIVPLVGASGAIAAVLGAYLVRFPTARVHVLFFFFVFVKIVRIPAVIVLGVWLAAQILAGMHQGPLEGGGVAWFAHIGGFAAGMVLVFLFQQRERVLEARRLREIWR